MFRRVKILELLQMKLIFNFENHLKIELYEKFLFFNSKNIIL